MQKFRLRHRAPGLIRTRRLRGNRVGVAAVAAAAWGLTLVVACVGCSESGGSPSSSPEEWRASVCDSGAAGSLNALAEGIDASDLHVCASSNAGAGAVYVVSGKYSSSDRLQYYLTNHAAFRGSPYATASASDGAIWAFVAFVDGIGQGDPAVALKPLEEFNFEIHATRQMTPSSSTVAQPSPTSPPLAGAASPGNNFTIADYIKQNGITETPVVKSGDPPGSPIVNLPSPPGWRDSGKTPSYAYGQIVPTDAAFASDPPTITAIYSRLTGDVDADAILRYAPGELNNLPGYTSALNGETETFAGFPAYKLTGFYLKNGVRRVMGQRTVVIPGRDGLYVLQLNAESPPDAPELKALTDAFKVIKEQTAITQ